MAAGAGATALNHPTLGLIGLFLLGGGFTWAIMELMGYAWALILIGIGAELLPALLGEGLTYAEIAERGWWSASTP